LEADRAFVSQFAGRFFGLDYMGYRDSLDYLKQQLAEGYFTEFVADFFPPGRIREIREKKLVLSFQPAQPPKLVKLDGVADEFQVAGTLTMVSHAGRTPQRLSAQPVALDIKLRHIAGAKGLVYRVSSMDSQGTESAGVSPDSKESPAQASPKDKKDDGVAKFVGDAAGEAAKKALGINF
jgi:hypothetical protein